jgi:hypothetical protein
MRKRLVTIFLQKLYLTAVVAKKKLLSNHRISEHTKEGTWAFLNKKLLFLSM